MIKNCVAESKKFFENAEELVAWEGMLSIEEAKMILGYVKGHGYGVCLDANKYLLLVDLEEPENEPEAFYDVTDLMARINQWNYEFLLDDTVTGDWRESIKRDASIIADLQERLCFVRGHYIGTPTVKELIAILSKLPQDYKVTCCGGENYLYRFEGNKYITIDHEEFLEV